MSGQRDKGGGHHPWQWAVVLFAPVALTACLATSQPTSQPMGGRGFLVTVWASAKCVNAGDILAVRATVANDNSDTKIIDVKERPVFDLSIGYRTSRGNTIIEWSDSQSPGTDLTHLELKPGESKIIEMNWTVPNPPPSVAGVAASFVADPSDIAHPLAPFVSVYGPSGCPGPFGP